MGKKRVFERRILQRENANIHFCSFAWMGEHFAELWRDYKGRGGVVASCGLTVCTGSALSKKIKLCLFAVLCYNMQGF